MTPPPLRALVRRPSPRLAEGLVTHLNRVPVDLERAVRQWEDYVAVLAKAGWRPIEVPPADDCPDGVFVEDTMVVFRDVATIARPAAPSRRPETADAEAAVAGAGYRIRHLTEPATLDGGNVLKVGSTVYVGLTERTNAAAAEQLAAIVATSRKTTIVSSTKTPSGQSSAGGTSIVCQPAERRTAT